MTPRWTRSTPRYAPWSRPPCSSPTRAPTPISPSSRATCSWSDMPTLTYRDALNQALREEMQRDPGVFLLGEEVGGYQGAYKVSRGLLEEFGPMRVADEPTAAAVLAGGGRGQ